jgi:tetratricopeptide (TPR) repeat protein
MSVHAAYDHCLDLGLTASLEQRTAAALAHFARASALAPSSGVPHLLMGAEHACRGELPLAEAAFVQALRLAPGLHLARYQLGLLQFGAQRTAEAMATWHDLLALSESQPLGHFVRGFAALLDDDCAASVRHFRRGLALSRDEAAAALGVGTVVDAVERMLGDCAADAREDPQAGGAGRLH